MTTSDLPNGDRLEGWKEIARYLGREVRTVQRWEATEQLPIHRQAHERRGAPYAYRTELDRWRAIRHVEPLSSHQVSPAIASAVEPTSLSDLIVKGGLPLTQILTLAIPLADAISATHQKGITYRDLKPANVMIGADGRIKVLDFGLANVKTAPLAEMGGTGLPKAPLTGDGRIVGTVAYMSPEQAEGKPLDHRSDVFSLGVMLYEMATGERPFKGDTSISIISSIVKDTPKSVTELNATLPRELGRIIRRALAKDPEQRYQNAKDLRNDLAKLTTDLDSGAISATATVPRTSKSMSWSSLVVAAAIITAALIGGYAWWRSREPLDRIPARVEATFTQVTAQPGVTEYPSLSPDGKWIVYDGNQSGNADIYLQGIGGLNAINLTKDSPDDDTQPAFSPDGESIAFRSERQGGGIFVMGRTGESVRRVTDRGFNPAWSPDGSQLVFSTTQSNPLAHGVTSELWVVTLATGTTHRISEGDAVQPSWSPHGQRIAFWGLQKVSAQRDIWTIPATGGPAIPVTSDAPVDWNPVWSPDGRYLYFASNRGGSMNLWRIAMDERTGKVLGAPEAFTTPAAYAGHVSLSADGRSIAYGSFAESGRIQKVSFDPVAATVTGTPTNVHSGSQSFTSAAPSPDGAFLAFVSGGTGRTTSPQLDIWISRPDGTALRQLTNDPHRDLGPRWAPDGQRIAFFSNRSGSFQVWSIKSDGSDLRQLTDMPAGVITNQWSPDGSKMVTYDDSSTTQQRLVVFDPRKAWHDQTPQFIPIPISLGVMFEPESWSPDGRWLVGLDELGTGVFVYSFATRQFTWITESGWNAIWLNDSRRLLFTDRAGQLRVVEIGSKASRDVFSVLPDTIADPALSRDNRTLYFTRVSNQSDIWLLHFTSPVTPERK